MASSLSGAPVLGGTKNKSSAESKKLFATNSGREDNIKVEAVTNIKRTAFRGSSVHGEDATSIDALFEDAPLPVPALVTSRESRINPSLDDVSLTGDHHRDVEETKTRKNYKKKSVSSTTLSSSVSSMSQKKDRKAKDTKKKKSDFPLKKASDDGLVDNPMLKNRDQTDKGEEKQQHESLEVHLKDVGHDSDSKIEQFQKLDFLLEGISRIPQKPKVGRRSQPTGSSVPSEKSKTAAIASELESMPYSVNENTVNDTVTSSNIGADSVNIKNGLNDGSFTMLASKT